MRCRAFASLPVWSLAGCLWALMAGGPAAAAEKREVDYRSDVVYAKLGDEELKLDIAAPQGLNEPTPLILFIHGGGWQGGRRQDMAPLVKQAAADGYVAATVSYRFAPKHTFPAQVEDCKCAVRYLRAHADELHVDPQRIGACGMSAGAHLAMMLGTMDSSDGLEGDGGHADQSSKVQAVVSFVGPTNLTAKYPDVAESILAAFLGGNPEEKLAERKRASPMTYVSSGDAPMLLFFGTKDPLIPYDQAFDMTKALTDAGVPARVELIIGAGHGWPNPEMERTLKETMTFFDRYLAPAKPGG